MLTPLRRPLASLALLALAAVLGMLAALHTAPPVAASTPCTGVTLWTEPLSQQSVGSAVRMAGGATGCPNPSYQF